jgi:hypothetical protein
MRLSSILLICLLSFELTAQDTNYVDPNYKPEKQKQAKRSAFNGNRVYFGGTFGMQFGTFTSILVEPMVGYRFTEKLSSGVGLGLRYGRDNRAGSNIEYTNYIGRAFARYLFLPNIFGHVEYMAESYDDVFYFDGQSLNHTGRTLVPFLFVGGGLRSQAGRGSFIIQVLFNVLQSNPYSREVYPSGQPYISIGYISGF